jgi:hypothetical protein
MEWQDSKEADSKKVALLYNYSPESRAAGQSCTDHVILEFSFLEGELLARANSICLCEKGILY